MILRAILRDETLSGHALTSMTEKIWELSKYDLCFYDRPDPGTRVVDADYLIAQKVHYNIRNGRGWIFRTEFFFEKPLFDLIESVVRRVLAPCAAAASLFLLAPLGFTAKLVHVCIRQIAVTLQNSPVAEKTQQIWGDSTLFGHALTSAPAKLAQLTMAPLHWHLRANGTDRRSHIVTYIPGPTVIQQSEYELVPFELFEVAYRGLTGTATLVAGMLSPLGFAAKAIHLASQNVLRT
jgi:hypothetical protein